MILFSKLFPTYNYFLTAITNECLLYCVNCCHPISCDNCRNIVPEIENNGSNGCIDSIPNYMHSPGTISFTNNVLLCIKLTFVHLEICSVNGYLHIFSINTSIFYIVTNKQFILRTSKHSKHTVTSISRLAET